MTFNKIWVVGTSGSGKSTLANNLSKKLELPHVQLDELYWGKNWTPVPPEQFEKKVREVTNENKWILCGNYRQAMPIIVSETELIIWLDYSLFRIYAQTLKRSFKRILTREELWKGTENRETFKSVFFSRDSILLWIAKTYRLRKHQFSVLKKMCEGTSVRFLHFKSLKELREYSDTIDH